MFILDSLIFATEPHGTDQPRALKPVLLGPLRVCSFGLVFLLAESWEAEEPRALKPVVVSPEKDCVTGDQIQRVKD